MIRNHNILTCMLLLLSSVSATAQVLWSDNFDSYTTGPLSNDPTGLTPGKGGWRVLAVNSEIRVESEPGRGNVVAWGWINGIAPSDSFRQNNLGVHWNNRNFGNDVLKFEYEMYAKDFSIVNHPFYSYGGVRTIVDGSGTQQIVLKCDISSTEAFITPMNHTYPTGTYQVDYKHTWIKVESYVQYDSANDLYLQYTYVPSLNYLAKLQIVKASVNNWAPDVLYLNFSNSYNAQMIYPGPIVMYDNFKLSAISTLPSYLKVDEFLASKFNVFPNPANNVVNIINSENMAVQQVSVYDVSGKQLNTQSFNNAQEIQLNVENLASGTYMLHIQSDSGTAVKKLIKK